MPKVEQHRAEAAVEAIKSAPAAAVATAGMAGVTLNDAVLIATLIYVVLQIGYLAFKWIRCVRAGNHKDDDR